VSSELTEKPAGSIAWTSEGAQDSGYEKARGSCINSSQEVYMQTSVGSGDPHAKWSPAPTVQPQDSMSAQHPGQIHSAGSNVAVIAIHGVGQHPTGASADAVSTLLLELSEHDTKVKSEPLYPGFISTFIDVPLRPVCTPSQYAHNANDRNQETRAQRIIGIFDERRGFLAQKRKNAPQDSLGYDERELRPNEPDRGEYGYQFMVTQLAGYRGEVNRDFQTIRLEGKRADTAHPHTVHIYDAHYSDLTKPQNTILAFFFAFYQLLFHLASLSLMAVYWAEAENVDADPKRTRRWRLESSIHATSVRFLTMCIPILNVILLVLGCCAFIDKVPEKSLPGSALARAVAVVISLAAAFWCFREKKSPSRPFLWALVPIVSAAIGVLALSGLAYLYNYFFGLISSVYSTLLLFEWLIVAGVVMAYVAKKFDQLRPGAFFLSVLLYLANVSLFFFYLLPCAARLQSPFATTSLWAIRWIFAELVFSWIVCLGSAFISWPLSAWCVSGIKHDRPEEARPRKARSIAAFRTGRFAFAVPAILFVIATCALWSGVLVLGSFKLKAFSRVSCGPQVSNAAVPLHSLLVPGVDPVVRWVGRVDDRLKIECDPNDVEGLHDNFRNYWHAYLIGLLLTSVTPSLSITMALFGLGLLLLTWAILPSVIFELKPEWALGVLTARIRSLGHWLSLGLDNIAILTRIFWLAIVPIPLIFLFFDWHALDHPTWTSERLLLDRASGFTLPLIQSFGAVLAVAGVAVFTSILKYFTTVLDAILDVDNYLRTSPLDQTPRARIAERCVSLLRYIAAYKDDQGRPYYSKVIIVAHSLGSMVTVDLLRYLERSAKDAPDPALARYHFREQRHVQQELKLPIHVFSMGSPLRQLLNRFFPHLYWWVCDEPDNSLAPVGAPLDPPLQIRSALPRSDEMNVTSWSNAYRSGDYIGRSLWAGQWLQRSASGVPGDPPDSASEPFPRACCEICVGLGAHTHYWDRSAPDIAHHLDALIK
jgi:hypothetical protein